MWIDEPVSGGRTVCSLGKYAHIRLMNCLSLGGQSLTTSLTGIRELAGTDR